MTNRHVDLISITKTGAVEPSSSIHGLHCSPEIDVICHESGILTAIEQAWKFDDSGSSFTDVTAAFNSTGTNVTLWDDDNDIVYLGKDSKFTESEWLLTIGSSGAGINPEFEFWNGAWVTLALIDNTNGMKISGSLIHLAPPTWIKNIVNGVNKFYMRIVRTQNSLGTVPTESIVTYSSTIQYIWDEDGNLNVNTIDINSLTTDVIDEKTPNVGVTIDGVLLKDSQLNTNVINELTATSGVTIDGVLLKDGEMSVSLEDNSHMSRNKFIIKCFMSLLSSDMKI